MRVAMKKLAVLLLAIAILAVQVRKKPMQTAVRDPSVSGCIPPM
jgi:hypothetical protein